MYLGLSKLSLVGASANTEGTPSPVLTYDPTVLFSSGEVGMLYDPQKIETLWQDTAGTIPVTADGQLVARIDDRSGNGYHLTQATAANQYKYREADGLKWLDSEGRACIYATTQPLTGPLSYGFSAEITQSTSGGTLFDTGSGYLTDAASVFVTWSSSSAAVRMGDRGGSVLTQSELPSGANRHIAAVARLAAAGSNTYLDYGRAALLNGTPRLSTNTTTGPGFRLGPTSAKAVRFYGLFVIQRLISDEERTAVGAYYASLGRLESLAIWMGDAQ